MGVWLPGWAPESPIGSWIPSLKAVRTLQNDSTFSCFSFLIGQREIMIISYRIVLKIAVHGE